MALPSTTHPRGAHTTGPARTAIGALLALLLAVTGAVIGALPASAADTASIVGQVYVKKVGGQPVPADYAYGYLYKYDGENFWSYPRSEDEPGWSADDGMFDITGLPAGRYKLEINSAGTWDDDTRYQREYYNDRHNLHQAKEIVLGAGESYTLEDPVLEEPGWIEGRVLDAAGNPLPGASASFVQEVDGQVGGGWGAQTGEDGRFRSENDYNDGLVRGEYRIDVSGPWSEDPDETAYEWVTLPGTVQVSPGETVQIPDVQLRKMGLLRLDVRDPEGAPVPTQSVWLWFRDENDDWLPAQFGPNETDEEGIYRWPNLRPGDGGMLLMIPGSEERGTVDTYWPGVRTFEDAQPVEVEDWGQVINARLDLLQPEPEPGITAGTVAITGKPRTGATLRAVTDGWDAAATLSYRWLVGGKAIAAAKPTLRVTNKYAGKRITVQVTAARAGAEPVTVRATPTAVAVGRFTKAPRPRIKGVARVGQRLRAMPGKWKPKVAKVRYQWFRGKKRIKGATRRGYVLRPADRGKRISVRVRGARKHVAPLVRKSKPTVKVRRR